MSREPPKHSPPEDADTRRSAKPVVCYRSDQLAPYDASIYQQARESMQQTSEVIVAPRPVSYTHLTLPTNREV